MKKLAGNQAVAIRMEATKLLGGAGGDAPQPPSLNRQLLIMIGLASGIFLFLAIGVFARWRRKPAAEPVAAA